MAHVPPSRELEERVFRQAVKARLFGEAAQNVRVGRFVVLRSVGEGGMGVVYTAYDEKLDRKIAIKMLRPAMTRDARARDHVLREARAMARISHPNVVQVYDVGEFGDQIFVAMEYVEGPTLRQWLRSETRPWREILRVFVGAGEGLCAAHRKSLVHRDFKPDNVLIGEQGTPRVVDFGLARLWDLASGTDYRISADPVPYHSIPAGTPGYMAPEQRAGVRADARSDQYSFCASLYEALTGKLPDAPAPPSGSRSPVKLLPPWLLRAIHRGLSHNAEDRWPSMEELLRTLRRGPNRRTLALGMGGAMGAALGVAGFLVLGGPDPVSQRCDGLQARLDETWNEQRDAETGRAFAATGIPYAADTWNRLRARVTDYAQAWTGVHDRVCQGDPDADDARALEHLTCLDRQLAQLEALVPRLAVPGARLVETAATAQLLDPRAPARCLESTADVHWSMRPEDASAQLLWSELVATRVDTEFGDYGSATRHAVRALELAEQYENPHAQTEATLWQGILAEREGDYTRAESLLEQAYTDAQSLGDKLVALESAVELVLVVGDRAARYDEAHVRAMYARALIAQVPGPTESAAKLDAHVGRVLTAQARYQNAQEAFERSVAAYEALGPQARGRLADVLVDFAWTYIHRQQFDPAKEILERALALSRATSGPEHPRNVRILNTTGLLLRYTSNYDLAVSTFMQALKLGEASLGPKHPDLADVRLNLGWVYYRRGELQLAETHFQTALEIRLRTYPDDHPEVAHVYGRLGVIARARGELNTAESLQRRALAMQAAALGEDNPQLVPTLLNLASVLETRGDLPSAVSILQRAEDLVVRHHGEHHTSLSPIFETRARIGRAIRDDRTARSYEDRNITLWKTAIAAAKRSGGPESRSMAPPIFKVIKALSNARRREEALHYQDRLVTLGRTWYADEPKRLMSLLASRVAMLADLGCADGIDASLSELDRLAKQPGPDRELRRAQATFARARALFQCDPAQRDEAFRLAREAFSATRNVKPGGVGGLLRWLQQHDPEWDGGRDEGGRSSPTSRATP